MRLLDMIEELDCDQAIKDNLLDCVTKGLEKEWYGGDFEEYIFEDNDILDTAGVPNPSQLWDEIRDVQHAIAKTYR